MPLPKPLSPFEQRILALCKAQKLSPASLGTSAGLSKSTVQKWIDRSYSDDFDPASKQLKQLAQFAGVSIDWLLDTTPYVGSDDEGWRAMAAAEGFDPDDPEVAEVYQTAFKDAETTYGFAAAELRRRRAARKGKSFAHDRALTDDLPLGRAALKGKNG